MNRIFNTQLKMFSKFILCLSLFPAVGLGEGAAVSSFISNMNSALSQANAEINEKYMSCVAATSGFGSSACKATHTSEISLLKQVGASVSSYSAPQGICTTSAKGSEGLCSMVLSPGVKNVQKLLTVGQAAIGASTSATDACEKSSNLMSKAQTAMTAASVACSAIKLTCDTSCASAASQLTVINKQSLQLNSAAPTSVKAMSGSISSELTLVEAKITGCQKHEVSLVDMGTQAVGLYVAGKDAKACKEEISDDLTTAGGAAPAGAAPPPEEAITTEMCADAAIAAVPVCKCKADPKGEGCSGILADNKNPSTIKSIGKGSQLAGLGSFKQSGKISGLNSATEADLNSGIDPNASSANLNSDSGAATAADISAGKMGSAAEALDKATAGKDKAGKSGAGGIGSFGGGGLSGGGKKSENKVYTDGQIAEAKRQIAAERLQAEVSTASGKSNWEKISTRYVENHRTFYGK